MKYLFFILPLLLIACGQTPLTIDTKPIVIPIEKPDDPAMVRMEPVSFRVVNKDNLTQFIAELTKLQGSNNIVFIAITTTDYENLALNLADLKRYISQQKAIIVYYKTVTATPTK
jgi:hypothetical protein